MHAQPSDQLRARETMLETKRESVSHVKKREKEFDEEVQATAPLIV